MAEEPKGAPSLDRYTYLCSNEHNRYVKGVISLVAANTIGHDQMIPEDVFMIGNDWFSVNKVIYEEGIFKVTIDKSYQETPDPISKLVNYFYKNTPRLAIIPEGDERMQEARGLGDIVEEHEGNLKLRAGNKEIIIYRLIKPKILAEGGNINGN